MPLILYRRHTDMIGKDGVRRGCAVELRKKGINPRLYTACACPIWVAGDINGQPLPRQAIGTRDWKAAEKHVREQERLGQVGDSITISHAVERWIAAAKTNNLAEGTIAQYKLAGERFEGVMRKRGVLVLDAVKVDHLEAYKDSLAATMKPRTVRLEMQKIKTFFRLALRRGWVEKSPAEQVERVTVDHEPKEPFTAEEVERILEAVQRFKPYAQAKDDRIGSRPDLVRAAVNLMLETGLRASDTLKFRPSLCTKGAKLWVYRSGMKKGRGKEVITFLTDELYQSIMSAKWLSREYPFTAPGCSPTDARMSLYYATQRVGESAGVSDCRPHRFRDTFAVRKLLAGVSLEDVSKLLGHSSVRITELYYAKWVKARLDRLELLVADTLAS